MRYDGEVYRLRVEVDGQLYEVGPVKASEAERISGWTGYSVREWEAQLVDAADALAAKAVVALFAFRAGEHPRFQDIEIEDVDTIDAQLLNEKGQVLSFKMDHTTGRPVMPLVKLLDGKEVEDRPTKPRSKAAGSPSA